MTWLDMTPEEVREMAEDPVDDSPLSDDELDELDAWLLFNAAAESGMSHQGRHPINDVPKLYRAVHELVVRRRGAVVK